MSWPQSEACTIIYRVMRSLIDPQIATTFNTELRSAIWFYKDDLMIYCSAMFNPTTPVSLDDVAAMLNPWLLHSILPPPAHYLLYISCHVQFHHVHAPTPTLPRLPSSKPLCAHQSPAKRTLQYYPACPQTLWQGAFVIYLSDVVVNMWLLL